MPPAIEISQVKAVVPTPAGDTLLVKVAARVGDEAAELEIAITTELAPAVAIALLATTAQARAERDGLAPALEVLAAAVVSSGSAEKVRLQLLFEKGAVLPIEMPADAGLVLQKALSGALPGS
ncbi:MAG: hypothetical protein ABI781_14275 [Burkholderiales bacterium]